MTAWLVAGPAGSGKSTLARALAARTRACLLDLDTLTNPLLDALLGGRSPGLHWNDADLRAVVRPARYACLTGAVRDQAANGRDLVLAAPFTAELRGGEEWGRLVAAAAPHEVRVLWLTAPPEVLVGRLASRGEARDARPSEAQTRPPSMAYVALDGTWTTDALLHEILGEGHRLGR